MRKTFLFLLIIISHKAGITQDSLQYVFKQQIDLNNNLDDIGMKSIYWNDGILTLGYCFDAYNREGLCLSFLDTLGKLVWKKNYYHPISSTLQGNDIIAFNDYSFYVTGIVYTDEVNEYDAFYAKFNSLGDTVFFQYYADTGTTFPFNFYEVSQDTLLILSGHKIHIDDDINRYVIWRIDSIGNINVIYESSWSLKYANQIYRENANFLVGGTTTTASGNVKVFIDVYDSDFNSITHWSPNLTLNEYFLQLFTWNGNLFLASTITDYWSNLLRIGHLNNGVYHGYNTVGPYTDGYWSNILVLDDKSITSLVWADGKSIFYFLDTCLTPITTAQFTFYPDYLHFNGSICLLPSKKITGTGELFTFDPNTQNHLFFLTENIVNYLSPLLTNSIEIPVAISHNASLVYPNPFSNKLNISIPYDKESYHIAIYSLAGKKVLEKMTSENTVIDTQSLAPGVYVVQVNTKTTNRTFKVIKAVGYK